MSLSQISQRVFEVPSKHRQWHAPAGSASGPFETLRLETTYRRGTGPNGASWILHYRLRGEAESFVPADLTLWKFIQQAEKVYGREEYLLGLPVLVPRGTF